MIRVNLTDGTQTYLSAHVYTWNGRKWAVGWFQREAWLLDYRTGAYIADIFKYRDNLGIRQGELPAHQIARMMANEIVEKHGVDGVEIALAHLPKING